MLIRRSCVIGFAILALVVGGLWLGQVPAQEKGGPEFIGEKKGGKEYGKDPPNPVERPPIINSQFRRPKPATAEQVAQWIKDLGDKSFKVRAAANKGLEETGPPALKALREAAKDQDLEIQQRARSL